MGRISSETEEHASSHTHFSHPHPLHLISSQQTPNLQNLGCAGCKLKPSGMIYSCTVTTFFLHEICFLMPTKITHPFHKDHNLTLLPKSPYADGLFSCDACGETGDGFSYSCRPCGIDLHTLCAAAPLSLAIASHAHELELAFGSPYEGKKFFCDVCRDPDSDHWLYRCKLECGFDAHLKCARAAPPPRPRPEAWSHTSVPPTMTRAVVPGVPANGVNYNGQNYMTYQQAQNLLMMQNNPPASGAGSQQLMRMIQLMSGTSRSLDSLQFLLGNGGGGGLDPFQSLLGGGGGGLDSLLGGGGLDFLGGLL